MIEHHDLSYPVYKKLKEMILRKKLKPGEKLLQDKLASELGVSRTPLLKALQMLEYDYLVESIPRRGMYVKDYTVEEMIEIYEVREGIESMAIRLTTERINQTELKKLKAIWAPFIGQENIDEKAYRLADEKFHALLLDCSKNQILKKTYNRSVVAAVIIQMGLQRPPKETLIEHLEMIAAIEEGNAEKAELAMRNQLRKSKNEIAVNFNKE
jgi:DNA-binding GntR family transcriptional regulator